MAPLHRRTSTPHWSSPRRHRHPRQQQPRCCAESPPAACLAISLRLPRSPSSPCRTLVGSPYYVAPPTGLFGLCLGASPPPRCFTTRWRPSPPRRAPAPSLHPCSPRALASSALLRCPPARLPCRRAFPRPHPLRLPVSSVRARPRLFMAFLSLPHRRPSLPRPVSLLRRGCCSPFPGTGTLPCGRAHPWGLLHHVPLCRFF